MLHQDSKRGDALGENQLYMDMSGFVKESGFGNYSVPPPPIPYVPFQSHTLPRLITPPIKFRERFDFASSLQSLRGSTLNVGFTAPRTKSWMGHDGERRASQDLERTIKELDGVFNRRNRVQHDLHNNYEHGSRFEPLYEDADGFGGFQSRACGKPLPHNMEELYRKLNMLVINVELQNKKIEEIRRACQNRDCEQRYYTTTTSTTTPSSPPKDGSVQTELTQAVSLHSIYTPSTKYVINHRKKCKNGATDDRQNTYRSYEDIDDLSPPETTTIHLEARSPPKTSSFARKLISCVRPMKNK